ncbi:MAG: SDR family NAD(P)-dependent oxidoreductase [Myxococcota bacterium]
MTEPRVALVVGASRGVGLALTELLLRRDDVDRVVATAREPESSASLRALAQREPDRLLTAPLDVTDESSLEAAAARIGSWSGPTLHWLVNCAGLLHAGSELRPEKKLEDVSPEALRAVFEVNAFGPLLLAKHFLRFLRHGDRAVFASLSARMGSIGDNRLGGWYAYRASKSAQNMFLRTLSIECRRRAPNVLCLALHPGTVETELSEPYRGGVPAERLFSPSRAAEQLLDVIDASTPDDHGAFLAWDGTPIPW